MEHRAISGEVLEDASERIKGLVAETEPDLVIWKVGTPEMLARSAYGLTNTPDSRCR